MRPPRAILLLVVLLAWAAPAGAGDLEPEGSARAPWESTYRERLQWWSLQPVVKPAPPPIQRPPAPPAGWPRTDVDRFILARLQARGLQPAAEADRRVLARRLSFALLGLPPAVDSLERFVADRSPQADDAYLESLLASPHFGERWARHWMDVVHYADTHGYEWDAPAKHAWRYRDYLIRAFNADISVQRLLREQIAGDLLEPRLDPATGLNEALIGPMALRLGERRHGDNAAAEGVTQEAIANIIDTVGKGFLGTTVACAQCHDHKLDAIAQRDYYALAGVFMSTRWSVRTVDARDPNRAALQDLHRLKREIRREIARLWQAERPRLAARIRALPLPTNPPPTAVPASLAGFWHRAQTNPVTAAEFARERHDRQEANRTNLTLWADFTTPDGANGWRWEGFGLEHGLVPDGEPVVALEGDQALQHVLPAGRWSHAWSMRLAGALRSPLLDGNAEPTFSVGFAGGHHVAQAFIVDHAFHSERMKFLHQPAPDWLTLKAGDFDSLEGSLDRTPRRVYLELATKALNNYFPPRTAYGGLKESDLADERSWFGVTRIHAHPPGRPPRDELGRFTPLWTAPGNADTHSPGSPESWAERLATLVADAVDRWSRDAAEAEDVPLLNDAIAAGLLPNSRLASPDLTQAIARYREAERRLQPDRTIGSVAEWPEGRNERIGLRGSYTELGDEVPRGNIRFLAGPGAPTPPPGSASGRLELARAIADDRNPLTARVFVNRVWLHLFGEGLVRTPDDFGHLGASPSHPELLDDLAVRFMAEGWSLKSLVRLLVRSATWRQDSRASPAALAADPENRLWHHLPLRRLDAESLRDSILAVSGRLDPALYGPPIDPPRAAEDTAKRLFSGPLDGLGRRSLYTRVTLMEPPRFLALFNQPLPKVTMGRRDVTSVPDQALALLNDPFVVALARHWSGQVVKAADASVEARCERMFLTALSRPPGPDEARRLAAWVRAVAAEHHVAADAVLGSQPVWQDVAHALFNLKEFLYVP